MKAFVITFLIVLSLGTIHNARATADPLPPCSFEDGNTDGLPCVWIDPDTGRGYINLSEQYRGE